MFLILKAMEKRREINLKLVLEPGNITEVDIVSGEDVLIPNIKTVVIESPLGPETLRIEFLAGHQQYDLSRSLVERTGRCGMIRFHQPGKNSRP